MVRVFNKIKYTVCFVHIEDVKFEWHPRKKAKTRERDLDCELSMTSMTLSLNETHIVKLKSNSLHTHTHCGSCIKAETNQFAQDALVHLPNVQLYDFLPAIHSADYASSLINSPSLSEKCYECYWWARCACYTSEWTCWSDKPAPAQGWPTEGSDWRLENILYKSAQSL